MIKKFFLKGAAVAAIIVALTPISAQAANLQVSITPQYLQTNARAMLSSFDKWRAGKNWYYAPSGKKEWVSNLPALKYDYNLEQYAMQRAAETAVNFDHKRPNGTNTSGLIGNGYTVIYENLYASSSESAKNAEYVLDKFKEETLSYQYQAHRRGMLSVHYKNGEKRDFGFNAVGFACVKHNGCYYWVQILGRTSTGTVNTKTTAATNTTKTVSMTLNTDMIKRKKNADFTAINNFSVLQGTSTGLGKTKADIGLEETWPTSYVKVETNPTFTSKNTSVLRVNSNLAYGNAVGNAQVVAKEPITGTTKTVTATVKKNNVKNGFIKENGSTYLYKNGKKTTGWYYLTAKDGEATPHWSYFGADGKMRMGWQQIGTKNNPDGNNKVHMSYFGSNGWLRTGWQQMGKGTNNPDGNNKAHWSYFGNNGWLRTGWQAMGTESNPDGKNGKHMSYFGPNGWLRTGWQAIGTESNPDGKNGKHMSYFGPNGWLRTGWKKMGTAENPDGKNEEHMSYFGLNGWLRTGFQVMGTKDNPDGKNKEHWSYFGSNGWLVTNKTVTYKNTEYKSDSMGWLTEKPKYRITTGLRATATNGCNIYYSEIEGAEPKIKITGGSFNAHSMAKDLGAKCAVDAGMIYGVGTYYSYGKLWCASNDYQSGDTLVLRNNGWLDSVYTTSGNIHNLGVKWAIKGLNVYTKDGKRTVYADCGTNPYSFIAQDYSGNYYIGAFSNASFTVMHNSLKRIIPNLKFMYATEGGGHSKYIENGKLVLNGRGQTYRTTPGLIYFK